MLAMFADPAGNVTGLFQGTEPANEDSVSLETTICNLRTKSE